MLALALALASPLLALVLLLVLQGFERWMLTSTLDSTAPGDRKEND